MQKALPVKQNKQQIKAAKKPVTKVTKRKLTTKKLKALKAPFSLPDLPYPKNACEPHMTAETFSYHHGKHHKTYITNLNNFVEANEGVQGASLEEIIQKAANKELPQAVFNNAAQHFNHSFFWHCLKPGAAGKPTGTLAKHIDQDFGSFDAFKTQFTQAAVTHFGSGWAFLTFCPKTKKLAIEGHHDASTPQVNKTKAIFTVDVWEHAYYIDTRNDRAKYVQTVMDNLANWDFAQQNLDESVKDSV